MKSKCIVQCLSVLFLSFVFQLAQAQNVGVGVPDPEYKLHIATDSPDLLRIDNTTALADGIHTNLYFRAGGWYTGAIKAIGTGSNVARLGLFSFASGNSASLLERVSILDNGQVGIGTITPGFLLDVNGRMRVRSGGGTAGIYFMNAANNLNLAFMGMYNDSYVGLFGNSSGWRLLMNTTTGNIGIGTFTPAHPFDVVGTGSVVASFTNTNVQVSGIGLQGSAMASAGYGIGTIGYGGAYGVWGEATVSGAGDRIGVYGIGTSSNGFNIGTYGLGSGVNFAYGIYGVGTSNGLEYAGYFDGDVYATGMYLGSDRKLKKNIQPLSGAIALLGNFVSHTYEYKTDEYIHLHLPEGKQYGLIADEVAEIIPGAVKKAVHPALIDENNPEADRQDDTDVEFNAVNYSTIIPILISAVNEQQALILIQNEKILVLEEKLAKLEVKQN